ncbi:hypothetical protein GQ602_002264 [Ophiocordyceps camponoti-floridani]|uniref:DUF3752 domain-containing protein n=1 Tax=Ophiocordyceps camponoti-floridani TaxID=2030778 RepID=A0A8H4QA35_9HYPO|nr:hypothetical protein GQ602_002264 [Ophiocordyceps camponoti-floridani]
MASIGPQLPAHNIKRKRTPSISSSGETQGPSPQEPANNTNADEIDLDLDTDDDISGPAIGPSLPSSSAIKDTIGPSLPPPPPPPPPPPSTSNNPTRPSADSDSDSDSDSYGPSLPSAATRPKIARQLDASPPPANTTYTERDPTRLRARKFASKPTAAPPPPPSSNATSVWTETPEEKLRRLQDSVLGRSAPEPQTASRGPSADVTRERESNIAATVKAQRGSSLYDEHDKKRRRGGVARGEEEDDPSKRAFDRDKDMALGGKIGTAQRRELVSKSANFGSRFQKGSYL